MTEPTFKDLKVEVLRIKCSGIASTIDDSILNLIDLILDRLISLEVEK